MFVLFWFVSEGEESGERQTTTAIDERRERATPREKKTRRQTRVRPRAPPATSHAAVRPSVDDPSGGQVRRARRGGRETTCRLFMARERERNLLLLLSRALFSLSLSLKKKPADSTRLPGAGSSLLEHASSTLRTRAMASSTPAMMRGVGVGRGWCSLSALFRVVLVVLRDPAAARRFQKLTSLQGSVCVCVVCAGV